MALPWFVSFWDGEDCAGFDFAPPVSLRSGGLAPPGCAMSRTTGVASTVALPSAASCFIPRGRLVFAAEDARWRGRGDDEMRDWENRGQESNLDRLVAAWHST